MTAVASKPSLCLTCETPLPPARGRPRKFCSDRCRKAQYARPCTDCGQAMSGDYGRSTKGPQRCPSCATAARTMWTRDTIVAAIHGWVARYGAIPAATDWNPSQARARGLDWRADRFLEGVWPFQATVQKVFGSWSAAISAAGYQPREGRPPRIRSAA